METKTSNCEGFVAFIEPKKKGKTKLIYPKCFVFCIHRQDEFRGAATTHIIRRGHVGCQGRGSEKPGRLPNTNRAGSHTQDFAK